MRYLILKESEMRKFVVTEPSGLKVQVFADSPNDAAERCLKGEGYPVQRPGQYIEVRGNRFHVIEVPEIVE